MIKQTLEKIRKLLESVQIDHALFDGMALGFYQVHRATNDIDFLIDEIHATALKDLLLNEGYSIFYESSETM